MTEIAPGVTQATALPKLPPAYRLVALEKVGSTNDEALRLAADGAEDGTIQRNP